MIGSCQDVRGARFAREVQLLSELSHPGIVRYIAHGVTPSGALFLVMEWLEQATEVMLDMAEVGPGLACSTWLRVPEDRPSRQPSA